MHIPWGLSQITSEQFLYHYCLTRLTSFREQSQTKLMQDCSLVSDYLPALSYSSTFLVAIMPEEQMAVECFEEFQKNSETIWFLLPYNKFVRGANGSIILEEFQKSFEAIWLHCCIKCPQNLEVKTLLQTYTAFTCRIYNEILLKVFDPRNRGNLLLKLQFLVL